MNTELLKKKILQLAMQGKLVEQDENDGTADELIDKILEEKRKLMAEGKIKKEKLSKIYKNPTDNHYYEKFEDGKEKDITDEIIFKVPFNWKYVRLKNIIDYQHGFSFKSSDYVSSSNVLNCRMSNIRPNGQFDAEYKKVFLPNSFLEKYKEYEIKDGDIILALTDMATENPKILGLPVIVKTGGHKFLLNQRVLKIQPLDNHITEYLQAIIHFLCIKVFLKKQKGSGSVQINLKTSDIIDLIIPIPPINEQLRICNKIKELFYQINIINDLYIDIENNKKILKNKIIELAIKGQLTKQLSNDGSSSTLIGKIIDEKHKLMAEGKIKKENLSIIYKDTDNQFYEKFDDGKFINITNEISLNIPESWNFVRLKNIIELISGRDLSTCHYNSDNKGIPYITGASNFEKNYLIINRWTEQPKVLAYKNDLLLTCKGTIGSTTILKEEKVHIARQIMALRNYDIVIDYLKLFIDSYINNLRKKAKGLIPGISRDDILNTIIPIPPIEEQKRIVSQINQLYSILE